MSETHRTAARALFAADIFATEDLVENSARRGRQIAWGGDSVVIGFFIGVPHGAPMIHFGDRLLGDTGEGAGHVDGDPRPSPEDCGMSKIEPGAIITCPNGHEICDVAKALEVGDNTSPKNFDRWREGQVLTRIGDPIQSCAICGEPYARPGMIHVRGIGWWPS